MWPTKALVLEATGSFGSFIEQSEEIRSVKFTWAVGDKSGYRSGIKVPGE